jgi:hypothetical protein
VKEGKGKGESTQEGAIDRDRKVRYSEPISFNDSNGNSSIMSMVSYIFAITIN